MTYSGSVKGPGFGFDHNSLVSVEIILQKFLAILKEISPILKFGHILLFLYY